LGIDGMADGDGVVAVTSTTNGVDPTTTREDGVVAITSPTNGVDP